MANPLAVEVAIQDPGDCPVAAASSEAASPVTDVSRTSTGGRTVTEEFTLPSNATVHDERVTEVAAFDSRSRYRFSRAGGRDCACEVIERTVGPVSTVRARGGTLSVAFVADSRADARDVVAALREVYDDVTVRRLVPADDPPGSDPVTVDRGELTDRQREAQETAHELGFFEYPRAANTAEVADALDCSTSTFREHLAAAQRKLFAHLLE